MVAGIVRDRYTKEGISELQIVLYDIDEAKREFADMGEVGPLVNDDDSIKPQVVDPTTAPPRNFTIDQASRPDARTWIDFAGDRLGSVLTDSKGHFALEYSDDLFQLGEKERRPDLVLAVLAPDHSRGVSVSARLLHYSYVPRSNAGRQENYIIHIDRSKDDNGEEKKRLYNFFGKLNSPPIQKKREDKRNFVRSIPGILLPFDISNSDTFIPPHAPQRVIATAVMNAI